MTSTSSLSILNAHYDSIVQDIMSTDESESSNNSQLQMILNHFKTVLDYNVQDGKKLRGTGVIDTVRAFTSQSDPATTALMLKQAAVVGWCIELMQASFLVADDLMDHSTTRRGKPCWYRQTKEELSAINDSFYLYSCTYLLLDKHFPNNMNFCRVFHDVFHRTVIGQGLDLETPNYLPSIDLYTETHYFTVVTWKTAYYTIFLPIACGLLISPASSLANHPEVKSISVEIGKYFQVQDDYLDCFGDVSQTGKIGTDIQERKCSWLIVQAVKLLKEKGDIVTLDLLRENYGQNDQTKVDQVKQIYDQLHLKQLYQDYAKKSYNDIVKRIENAGFNSNELEQLLKHTLDSIHARNK